MSEPSATAPAAGSAASAAPRGRRVLSGIKPTGTLHLGNYLGAMAPQLAIYAENDARYFIADYHSMTSVYSAAERRELALQVAIDYLALGLDPKRAILYRQSDLPEVHELSWALCTVAPLGLLERAHAYKDAREKGIAIEAGVFHYPVLMAADILLHSAHVVPVGQDQKQHIEMTRDLAQRFNQRYAEVFTLPDPHILEEVAVVPGTDGRKMSKSYGNTIEMFAPAPALKKQIMGIVTDSTPVEAPKDPSLPLFALWRLFASAAEGEELTERCRRGGFGYGDIKKDLLARVLEHFGPARERRAALVERPHDVEDILQDGARRAREATAGLLEAVREAAGLGPPRARASSASS